MYVQCVLYIQYLLYVSLLTCFVSCCSRSTAAAGGAALHRQRRLDGQVADGLVARGQPLVRHLRGAPGPPAPGRSGAAPRRQRRRRRRPLLLRPVRPPPPPPPPATASGSSSVFQRAWSSGATAAKDWVLPSFQGYYKVLHGFIVLVVFLFSCMRFLLGFT